MAVTVSIAETPGGVRKFTRCGENLQIHGIDNAITVQIPDSQWINDQLTETTLPGEEVGSVNRTIPVEIC